MKPWYASKTLWVNLIAVTLAVGYYLLDQPGIVPAAYASYVVAALGVLNIILRFMTDQPLKTPLSGKGTSTTRK